MHVLTEMLTYRRPSGSDSENRFIKRYLDSVPGMQRDRFGNRIRPGDSTMIACHTDTVHRIGGMQKVKSARGVISVADTRSNCLGADDTAGIYAALRMIEAGSPCTFVFHRAEEIGGLGSDWLARNCPEWLAEFRHCVSLDRRGTSDVIEYQCIGRCCSLDFATALSGAIGLGHTPARGTFTDSANYVDLIPECTNLSVGYDHEHTARETLDTDYLERLIDRLCRVDWESLPVSRVIVPDHWDILEADPIGADWEELDAAYWAARGF
jgi:hypothetical protein